VTLADLDAFLSFRNTQDVLPYHKQQFTGHFLQMSGYLKHRFFCRYCSQAPARRYRRCII